MGYYLCYRKRYGTEDTTPGGDAKNIKKSEKNKLDREESRDERESTITYTGAAQNLHVAKVEKRRREKEEEKER